MTASNSWVVEVQIDGLYDYNTTTTGVDLVAIPSQPDAVEIYTVGPPGLPGPPGETNIGGAPVEVTDVKAGDLISFNGSAWTNRGQVDLVDGGNF